MSSSPSSLFSSSPLLAYSSLFAIVVGLDSVVHLTSARPQHRARSPIYGQQVFSCIEHDPPVAKIPAMQAYLSVHGTRSLLLLTLEDLAPGVVIDYGPGDVVKNVEARRHGELAHQRVRMPRQQPADPYRPPHAQCMSANLLYDEHPLPLRTPPDHLETSQAQ
ncbi:hypothetical protein BDZ97DRAFT_1917177 [Flammula alnicola]|nr:hypothetical protein BDZ97DRAFT_1917177 [Flammula alnicola]